MKMLLCCAVLLAAACGRAPPPDSVPLPAADPAVVAAAQAIALLQLDWKRALGARDSTFFLNTLTADFVVTGGREVVSRAEFIKAVLAGSSLPPWTRQEDMIVRVFGDFAVVTGLIWFAAAADSAAPPARYTEVWTRQAGRWQALHGHYNALQPIPRGAEKPAELPRSSQ
jgi:ketosteroid isomerase-like protein